MPKLILKEHISTEQLILMEIYEKEGPVTIEELQKTLSIPRTTIVEHLRLLDREGLIEKRKNGKTLEYYRIKEIADKMKEALGRLNDTYVHALGYIQQKRLKQMKMSQKGEKGNES